VEIRHTHWLLFLALGAALAIGSGISRGDVTPISPLVEDPATGTSYRLLSNADWPDSEAEADLLGGHLATISNQEQQDWVFDVFGGYGGVQRMLWIGFYDPSQDQNGGSHASNFVWVSGSPVTYTNWNAGEPNDKNGKEFSTAMFYPSNSNAGKWNDWNPNTVLDPIGIPFHGVVEFASVPEPSAFSLLAVFMIGMFCGGRRLQRRFCLAR
jgi:hypothetical protein